MQTALSGGGDLRKKIKFQFAGKFRGAPPFGSSGEMSEQILLTDGEAEVSGVHMRPSAGTGSAKSTLKGGVMFDKFCWLACAQGHPRSSNLSHCKTLRPRYFFLSPFICNPVDCTAEPVSWLPGWYGPSLGLIRPSVWSDFKDALIDVYANLAYTHRPGIAFVPPGLMIALAQYADYKVGGGIVPTCH